MACNDIPRLKYLTYSNCKVPFIGAFIDYMDLNIGYLRNRNFTKAEKLHIRNSKATLSATFLALSCLVLGLVSNVKFEVVTYDEEPLASDLHFMLLSQEEKLYIDDIDTSKVMWCLEASDCLVMLISCLLIWNSSKVRTPTSDYLFMPWLGATLRGLLLRQIPTAGALLYTVAVVDGKVNLFFLSSFFFLLLLEAQLWLEVGRVVRARWERRHSARAVSSATRDTQYELETLWSNDDADVHSVEMRNYVY